MIRTIIIDDEPSAIKVLTYLLKKNFRDEVDVIAISTSPFEGKELIAQNHPDLVFLDIEMPGMTGIELVRSFDQPRFRVVFVTAYDSYAVEAFRISAMDYLLKPVDTDDMIRVVKKISDEMVSKQNIITSQLDQLTKLLGKHDHMPEKKIAIAMVDRIVFVNIADMLYCEAHGAYTSIYLDDGKKIVASKSLGEFEAQLNHNNFFRIHHSILINLNKVKEFQRTDGGYVMMENNTRLEVSQRKRKDFLDVINHIIV